MKKILLVLAVATVGMVSCKKEEGVKPVKAEPVAIGGGATRDMSGMD